MPTPPPETRIGIAAMTSWGEAGNWLSAEGLSAALREQITGATVDVVPCDALVPEFREVGGRIKQATLGGRSGTERAAGYSAVLGDLLERFPAGAERDPENGSVPDLDGVVEWIERFRPDVLVGTKGVITRTLAAACRVLGLRIPLIDYVTNHAHFQFPVHWCPDADLHLARLPIARDYLIETCGFAPDRVRVVGYLVAATQLGAVEQGEVVPRTNVVVVSNRGGPVYQEIPRRLLSMADDVDLTMIALNDDELAARVQEMVTEAGATRWRVVTHLRQEDFFTLLRLARGSTSCALVCKASPNSIVEAAWFGMPMYLLRTGLPMEDWGADLVEESGIGQVFDEVGPLSAALADDLRDDGALGAMQRSSRRFADEHLDQESTRELLARAVTDVLRGVSEPAGRHAS